MATESPASPLKKKFQLKKPLFNQPTWASPKPLANGDDIFSRADKSYTAIAEEEQRRREKKAGKAALKAQEEEKNNVVDGHKDKKLRITVIDSDESEDEDDVTQSETEEVKATKQPTLKVLSSPKGRGTPISPARPRERTSLSSSRQGSSRKPLSPSPPPAAEIIDINSSDDEVETPPQSSFHHKKAYNHNESDNDVQITSVTPKRARPQPAAEEPVSEDEFEELARQARENARRKRLGLDDPPATSDTSTQSTLKITKTPNGSFLTESRHSQPPSDPVISLLITSKLPGTEAVIIKRLLNQRLRDVRLAWCSRQGFSDHETARILLTFRGKRVYDVNSCKSLGIAVDAEGNPVLEGEKDVLGEADRKIHMEAVTEDMYSDFIREQEKERRHDSDQEEGLPEPELPKPKEKQTRIILRAKGLDDFRLIVKESTTVSKIVTAFKMERKIGNDKSVSLMFDGERLDPSLTVSQTDISDMDDIDVYIK